MSLSIRDLKNLLDSKGSTSGTLIIDLQGLKGYLQTAFNARANTLPTDAGQSRSGTSCTGHLGSGAPPLTNVSHSLGDINDWQNSYLVNQTCSSQTWNQSWCASRTTCTCNTVVTCGCHGRDSDCPSRTTCDHGGDPGACLLGCQDVSYCLCHARTFTCNCRARSNCGSRTACDCHGRDSHCPSRTSTTTEVGCECDARCSCNAVNVFA